MNNAVSDTHIPLPDAFLHAFSRQFNPAEIDALKSSMEDPSPVSIRFNPYKVQSKPEGERIPWSHYGYYLRQRPSFTLDPMFHAGAYYVQEASSMFLETVFEQTFARSKSSLRILDLCAAPGGKTTLLSSLAGPESIVVANEVIRQRAAVLSDNVCRWGIGNVIVTLNDPSHFIPYEHFFDLIVVDAPCSGEGMFRKDPVSRSQWSEQNVTLCAARQRRILSDCWGSLRPGGVLIYSTCTFNTAENEENIAWLCDQYNTEPVAIETNPDWGVVRSEVQGINTFRFFPHRLRGEGFFTTVVRKGEGRIRLKFPQSRKTIFSLPSKAEQKNLSQWVRQPEYMTFSKINDTMYGYYASAFSRIKQLAEGLTVIRSGVAMGELFGTKLKPDHALAMFHDLSPHPTPATELELDLALDFLRKKDLDPSLFTEGVNRVCHKNFTLGWIKRIGVRCNNLYPKEFRINTL